MAKPVRPVPGQQELATLMHAALVHARKELADAELLLEHGSWPTAYALATLAFEEFGKAHICVSYMTMPDEFRDAREFWDKFYSHSAKIQVAHFVFTMFAQEREPPPPVLQAIEDMRLLAKSDNDLKMRGLYVDYNDGTVLDPADVGEDEAKRMVSNVRTCVDYVAPVEGDLLDPGFGDFMRHWSAQFIAQLPNAAAAIENDPDRFVHGARAVVREMRHGRVPEPPAEGK